MSLSPDLYSDVIFATFILSGQIPSENHLLHIKVKGCMAYGMTFFTKAMLRLLQSILTILRISFSLVLLKNIEWAFFSKVSYEWC